MNLTEAITLAVSHHPSPSRQLKYYYKWKIVLAGMRGDILITDEGYDRDSFMKWLRPKPVCIILEDDVKLALDGRRDTSEFVNEVVRQAISNE